MSRAQVAHVKDLKAVGNCKWQALKCRGKIRFPGNLLSWTKSLSLGSKSHKNIFHNSNTHPSELKRFITKCYIFLWKEMIKKIIA